MVKDICVCEEFTQGNETKRSWNRIGILIDKGDKQYVKLFHMPNVLASVFDQKKKGQSAPSGAQGGIDVE